MSKTSAILGCLCATLFHLPAALKGADLTGLHSVVSMNTYDDAKVMTIDHDGNIIVTGYSTDTSGRNSFYVAKYATANNALLWEYRYSGAISYSASDLEVDASNNVILAGTRNSDIYTAKHASSNGARLWEKIYNSAANNSDEGEAVAIDASGNVIVTGATSLSGTFSVDYYTAKYAAADGALLWEQRYDGGVKDRDSPHDIAVDASGNAIVTGYSFNGISNDFYTAKYASSNGALVWEKRYDGPTNSSDFPDVVAVDGSGNVIVAGSSGGVGGNGNPDAYTAKYSGSNGALLWEKRYDGPGSSLDRASAVAVDSSGNVIITGPSYGVSGNPDCYTAKYAGTSGALLWEKRYDGPAKGVDSTARLALDSSGNAVVTGQSYNAAGNFDIYTAAYAASDGALLWDNRFNGDGNGNDAASTVEMDQLANVYVAGSLFSIDKILSFVVLKIAPIALPSSFFADQVALPDEVYYLESPDGTPFGYYSYLEDPNYIYHFDLGYEYIFDAEDGEDGVYLYDFTSGHFFYTSPSFPFPYLFDFTLNAAVYYYPDITSPGHYTTNPRYFYNFSTGQIFTQ